MKKIPANPANIDCGLNNNRLMYWRVSLVMFLAVLAINLQATCVTCNSYYYNDTGPSPPTTLYDDSYCSTPSSFCAIQSNASCVCDGCVDAKANNGAVSCWGENNTACTTNPCTGVPELQSFWQYIALVLTVISVLYLISWARKKRALGNA